MPTYEYACRTCGSAADVKWKISEDAFTDVFCPNGHLMHRKFSAPAVVFKGSGFYSTSNRKVTS